jgi:putative ABC transport system permease protein
MPRVAGAFSKATMLRNMQEISARNIRIMSTVLTPVRGGHRRGRGLQQRAHRAGRAHLGAGQPARAGLHARRGVGLLLGELALLIAVALPLGMLPAGPGARPGRRAARATSSSFRW